MASSLRLLLLTSTPPFRSFLLSLLLLIPSLLPASVFALCASPPIIFNFGDSNSDTGALAAGLGFPVNPPYGRTYFGRSTGRLSDGRLLIDFLFTILDVDVKSLVINQQGIYGIINSPSFYLRAHFSRWERAELADTAMASSLRLLLLTSTPPFRSFLLSLLLLIPSLLPASVFALCASPPIIFNFGDSNSDTGALAAGLGFPVNPPYGRTYFGRSTGRLSDGRLLIDFLCQSLGTSFLSPYLDSLGSNFQNGANFAVVGSSTLPKFVPFALNIQIMQFLHFKARSLELVASGSKGLINEEGFGKALYMIDIGQNDLADSFAKALSYPRVIKRIPLVCAEIKSAVKSLYDQGGRKFWIHNTGPLGCLPQKLSMVHHKAEELDSTGCISSYNTAAKLFNQALLHLSQQMRSEMKDATIVYVDMYSIKYDLISNAAKYGFDSPLMTCCGSGGPPYNYNINVTCGTLGARVCADGSQFVSWDGIHFTEAANSIVAKMVLSMDYSTPRVPFDFFCRR